MNTPKKKKIDLQPEKPINTKGINTVTGDDNIKNEDNNDYNYIPLSEGSLTKPFTEALEYKDPKDSKEAFMGAAGEKAGSSITSSVVDSTGLINAEALNAIYAPVDLSQALPDANERAKFKNKYGSKEVQLFNQNTIGVRFERDLEDLAIYKEKQYPLAVKQFMDDLDENQAWYASGANGFLKTVGSTSLAIASLLPTIYGAGQAIYHGDSSKMFDNDMFDAWEDMQSSIDVNLAVYGGSGQYNLDKETGEFKHKEFFARFWDDPMKSYNADLAPAVSFVAGAVITELGASALTAATGGAGSGILAANTARLTGTLANWGTRLSNYTKANRVIRGLDKLDDITSAARVAKMTSKYKSTFGTIAAGYRSASYESALIARDTQDATLQSLVDKHNSDPENQGNPPTPSQMAEYERAAKDAGVSAYFMNIPLVAGSNFIQMPRLFMKNYTVARTGGSFMKNMKMGGTRYVKDMTTGAFKHAANAESKLLRRLGYVKAFSKGPITEGWEEFAQGAMQEGLVDYYAQNYSADSNRNLFGMLSAIRKQGSAYLGTVEGRDSVTIGALMGMLGMRAPVRIDNATGKMSFSMRGTAFGGSLAEVREAKKKVANARKTAITLNATPISPMLKQNMDNNIRHRAIQKDLDEAAISNSTNAYKNKEHDSLFSIIYNRTNQGLADTIFQEIDALDQMSLDEFNNIYSTKTIEEFTEESKKIAINKARKNAESSIKSIEQTRDLLNKVAPDLFQTVIREVTNGFSNKNRNSIDPALLNNSMKEQLAYLHSVVDNTKNREVELAKSISELTNNSFRLDALNKVATEIVGINKKDGGSVEFTNKAEETKKAILQEWKENDLDSYNMNIAEVEPLLNDILKLKIRRGEAAKLYQGMLTPKGAKLFAEFANELNEISIAEQAVILDKIIKEDAEKRRNAGLESDALNEKSIHGDSKITDSVYDKSTKAGLAEYNNIDFESIEGSEELVIQNLLNKHPGLLSLVLSRLRDRDFPTNGFKTANSIWNNDTDGQMVQATFEILADLQKEFKNFKSNSSENPQFDNSEDYDQPSKEGSTKGDPKTVTVKGIVTKEVLDTTNEVGTYHIFINTYDKVIENGEVVLDPDTGLPMNHMATDNPMYRLDVNKVNSPDFLNNAELNNSEHEFQFRVQDNNPYNDTATVENLVIEVIYVDPKTTEETFISFLPAVKENTPSHLIALREEIVRRNNLTDVEIAAAQEERNAKMKALKDEKASIKQKLKDGIKKPKSSEVEVKKAAIKKIEADRKAELSKNFEEDYTPSLIKKTLGYFQVKSPTIKREDNGSITLIYENGETINVKNKKELASVIRAAALENNPKEINGVLQKDLTIEYFEDYVNNKISVNFGASNRDKINAEYDAKVAAVDSTKQSSEVVSKEINTIKSKLGDAKNENYKESPVGIVIYDLENLDDNGNAKPVGVSENASIEEQNSEKYIKDSAAHKAAIEKYGNNPRYEIAEKGTVNLIDKTQVHTATINGVSYKFGVQNYHDGTSRFQVSSIKIVNNTGVIDKTLSKQEIDSLLSVPQQTQQTSEVERSAGVKELISVYTGGALYFNIDASGFEVAESLNANGVSLEQAKAAIPGLGGKIQAWFQRGVDYLESTQETSEVDNQSKIDEINKKKEESKNNPVKEPKEYAKAVDDYKSTDLGSNEDAKNKKEAVVKQAQTKEGKEFVENQVAQMDYNEDGTITVYRSGTLQEGHNPATTNKQTAEIISSERKEQGLSSDIIEIKIQPSDISAVVPGVESEVLININKGNSDRIKKSTKKEQKNKEQLTLEKESVKNELEKTTQSLEKLKKDKLSGVFPFSDNLYKDTVKKQEAKIKNLEWQLKKYDAELASEVDASLLKATEVETLRQEEQAELLKAIPNAEKYLTDGKVDKSKIKNKKHIAKFEKIYDKYDKLISPLLKSQSIEEVLPEGFRYVEEGEVLPAGDYTTKISVGGKRNITNAPTKEERIQKELKARLVEVNEELSKFGEELLVDVTEGASVFAALNEFDAIKPRSKTRKANAKDNLEKDFGQANIDRARAINENFDNIVTQIQNSGMGVFIHPDLRIHEECK